MAQKLSVGAHAEVDNEQIGSLLKSWNLERVDIPGDGDCLFRSVAFGLIQIIQHGDKDIKELLLGLGVPETNLCDINYLQRLLRTRMVEEWEENVDQYQGYITDDLATISHTYLQSGQYTGDVGDLMVLTVANIPITVFTSVHNMPVLCVMPTSQSVVSTQPLFLPFTQSGPGHYDAVVSAVTQTASNSNAKCYCGRKSNFKGDSCFSIRCKCFLEKRECTYLCRCKACKNIYRARQPPSTTRRRMSYDEQRQPLKGKTTESFLNSKGEVIDKGRLTLLEDILLKGIIIYFIIHGLQITAASVCKVYQDIYRLCQLCDSVNFPLFERNERCIARRFLTPLNFLGPFSSDSIITIIQLSMY